MNKIYTFKCFKILNLIQIISAVLFSFACINFAKDFSVLAFLLAIIYVAIFSYLLLIKFLKEKNGKFVAPVQKMTQYLPYVLFVAFIIRRAGKNGTGFVLDLISVLLWLILTVTSFLVDRSLNPKNINPIILDFQSKPQIKKRQGISKILFEIVDWVDSFFWAIFTVMLFQVFVLQLYAIPSESMVPTFLVKDKVIVSKIDCGPKFPLTKIGLPDIRKYKRGDTIVLRNPHYTIDRKSEVKTVVSQLVYMFTFMQVDINKDENGEPKYDPLVKRIVGLPGDQLVMQDGTLYIRTKDNDVFTPSDMDERYATWNLNETKASRQHLIQTYPLSQQEYQQMLDFEQQRRDYDLDVAAFNAKELVRHFNNLCYSNNLTGDFKNPSLFEYDLFNKAQEITIKLLSQKGGAEWFESFMTSWIPYRNSTRDMYEESNYRLNVMTKLTFGNLVVRYAELYNEGNLSNYYSDTVLISNMQQAQLLHWYIQQLLDERNMPVFPACDENSNPNYIPKDCYFMMGDNRFNSLDLRHSSDEFMADLTKNDPMSVTYYSMMAPQYVHKNLIIGKPIFRFYPLNRMSRVR